MKRLQYLSPEDARKERKKNLELLTKNNPAEEMTKKYVYSFIVYNELIFL